MPLTSTTRSNQAHHSGLENSIHGRLSSYPTSSAFDKGFVDKGFVAPSAFAPLSTSHAPINPTIILVDTTPTTMLTNNYNNNINNTYHNYSRNTPIISEPSITGAKSAQNSTMIPTFSSADTPTSTSTSNNKSTTRRKKTSTYVSVLSASEREKIRKNDIESTNSNTSRARKSKKKHDSSNAIHPEPYSDTEPHPDSLLRRFYGAKRIISGDIMLLVPDCIKERLIQKKLIMCDPIRRYEEMFEAEIKNLSIDQKREYSQLNPDTFHPTIVSLENNFSIEYEELICEAIVQHAVLLREGRMQVSYVYSAVYMLAKEQNLVPLPFSLVDLAESLASGLICRGLTHSLKNFLTQRGTLPTKVRLQYLNDIEEAQKRVGKDNIFFVEQQVSNKLRMPRSFYVNPDIDIDLIDIPTFRDISRRSYLYIVSSGDQLLPEWTQVVCLYDKPTKDRGKSTIYSPYSKEAPPSIFSPDIDDSIDEDSIQSYQLSIDVEEEQEHIRDTDRVPLRRVRSGAEAGVKLGVLKTSGTTRASGAGMDARSKIGVGRDGSRGEYEEEGKGECERVGEGEGEIQEYITGNGNAKYIKKDMSKLTKSKTTTITNAISDAQPEKDSMYATNSSSKMTSNLSSEATSDFNVTAKYVMQSNNTQKVSHDATSPFVIASSNSDVIADSLTLGNTSVGNISSSISSVSVPTDPSFQGSSFTQNYGSNHSIKSNNSTNLLDIVSISNNNSTNSNTSVHNDDIFISNSSRSSNSSINTANPSMTHPTNNNIAASLKISQRSIGSIGGGSIGSIGLTDTLSNSNVTNSSNILSNNSNSNSNSNSIGNISNISNPNTAIPANLSSSLSSALSSSLSSSLSSLSSASLSSSLTSSLSSSMSCSSTSINESENNRYHHQYLAQTLSNPKSTDPSISISMMDYAPSNSESTMSSMSSLSTVASTLTSMTSTSLSNILQIPGNESRLPSLSPLNVELDKISASFSQARSPTSVQSSLSLESIGTEPDNCESGEFNDPMQDSVLPIHSTNSFESPANLAKTILPIQSLNSPTPTSLFLQQDANTEDTLLCNIVLPNKYDYQLQYLRQANSILHNFPFDASCGAAMPSEIWLLALVLQLPTNAVVVVNSVHIDTVVRYGVKRPGASDKIDDLVRFLVRGNITDERGFTHTFAKWKARKKTSILNIAKMAWTKTIQTKYTMKDIIKIHRPDVSLIPGQPVFSIAKSACMLLGMERLNQLNKHVKECHIETAAKTLLLTPIEQFDTDATKKRLAMYAKYEQLLIATLDIRLLTKTTVPNQCPVQ